MTGRAEEVVVGVSTRRDDDTPAEPSSGRHAWRSEVGQIPGRCRPYLLDQARSCILDSEEGI